MLAVSFRLAGRVQGDRGTTCRLFQTAEFRREVYRGRTAGAARQWTPFRPVGSRLVCSQGEGSIGLRHLAGPWQGPLGR